MSSNLNEGKFIGLLSQFNQKLFQAYFQNLLETFQEPMPNTYVSDLQGKVTLVWFLAKWRSWVLSQIILHVLPCFSCAPPFLISIVWVNTTITTITTTALLKVLGFGVVFQAGLWKDVMNSSDETAVSRECVRRPGRHAVGNGRRAPSRTTQNHLIPYGWNPGIV